MSNSVQGGGVVFAVGGSRLAGVTVGSRVKWEWPAAGAIIKEEDKTLVWRQELLEGENGVAKMYRHRGAWNRFCGLMGPARVQREFEALGVLADGGVPCSIPLLWGWGVAPEQGHFELLVTREIAGAVSLKQYFSRGGSPLSAADVFPLFDALRLMHERGVYHGALWPKNVLMTRAADGQRQFQVIDMARSIRFPGDIRGTAMARYDLLSLLHILVQGRGEFDAEAVLHRYGWPAIEAKEIAGQARRYHSTRHLRNRLALIFKLRALAGRGLWS